MMPDSAEHDEAAHGVVNGPGSHWSPPLAAPGAMESVSHLQLTLRRFRRVQLLLRGRWDGYVGLRAEARRFRAPARMLWASQRVPRRHDTMKLHGRCRARKVGRRHARCMGAGLACLLLKSSRSVAILVL